MVEDSGSARRGLAKLKADTFMTRTFSGAAIARVHSYLAFSLLALALCAGAAEAQYVDARLIPKGALRIDFSPHYTNYHLRFSLGTPGVVDGTAEPLGTDLTVPLAGSNIFPTLAAAEAAIQPYSGDPTYQIDIGSFQTIRDADVRQFPFGFSLGLLDRLTVSLNVPIVTTRSQVTFTNDTTNANVGWNLANKNYGDATTAAEAAALFSQLTTAISDVQAAIAAGNFGCPTSAGCDLARASVTRAQTLLGDLLAITGMAPGAEPVPVAPLATSAAGTALLAEIAVVTSQMGALGATPITATLPLPTGRLSADAINNTLLGGPDYVAAPIAFNRRTTFGDIEVGARLGVLMKPTARAVLTATVRLPTGRPARADNFVDIGTGDGQMDLEMGIEGAFEPGSSVGISFAASYTLQLAHSLDRRVATTDAPLVPLSYQALVDRDLGDVIRFSAYPTLRLSNALRVFGSAYYYHKGRDSFRYSGSAPAGAPPAALLETKTEMQALSLGAGIAYRSDMTSTGRTLPVEAGFNYRWAFSGSGGLTPKANSVQLYVRLFYRLF